MGGGLKDVGSVVWAKGVVLTPRPSGRLVGAEDLTERADCYLIHTPELRQASACVCVRETDREGVSTRNITDIKRGCLYGHLI